MGKTLSGIAERRRDRDWNTRAKINLRKLGKNIAKRNGGRSCREGDRAVRPINNWIAVLKERHTQHQWARSIQNRKLQIVSNTTKIHGNMEVVRGIQVGRIGKLDACTRSSLRHKAEFLHNRPGEKVVGSPRIEQEGEILAKDGRRDLHTLAASSRRRGQLPPRQFKVPRSGGGGRVASLTAKPVSST